nr:hypothetical protein YSBCXYJI_YSBCXYJI_CDS_0058 [Caudoviricetes sp.]
MAIAQYLYVLLCNKTYFVELMLRFKLRYL